MKRLLPLTLSLFVVGIHACTPEYVAPEQTSRYEVRRFGIDALLLDRYVLNINYKTLKVEPSDMVFGSDTTITNIELILNKPRTTGRYGPAICQTFHILTPDYVAITMQNPGHTESVDMFHGHLERGTYRVYFSVSDMFIPGEYPIEITVGEETKTQNLVMLK
jgi:hypothetical protein